MIQILQVALENEMDLTLAYKKSNKAAALIGLSMSTQTAFATAVSEVCREIIDKTHEGSLSIEIQGSNDRHDLAAVITYLETEGVDNLREGLLHAKKLVPVFNHSIANSRGIIELKLNIPRSAKLSIEKMKAIKSYFDLVEPNTPYEELRQRNIALFQINEQSETALRQAEYLNEQKNEFLSVAGHELKTPLTILRAYTQMALRSECSPATLAHIKKVDTQALKLQTMILQLLDISRIEKGIADYNIELVDFNGYLNDMADLIRQLVPSHELIITMDESRMVNIDKLRMEQVMMNIVGNAAKYSPGGKQIMLDTNFLENGDLLIAVRDEGIGMSEEELLKVFEKFYRVQDITKLFNGLGMGLFICSKIISDHGGKIWAESKKGEGSTFFFTLPAPVVQPD
jgi:signal transduction histidine kinase